MPCLVVSKEVIVSGKKSFEMYLKEKPWYPVYYVSTRHNWTLLKRVIEPSHATPPLSCSRLMLIVLISINLNTQLGLNQHNFIPLSNPFFTDHDCIWDNLRLSIGSLRLRQLDCNLDIRFLFCLIKKLVKKKTLILSFVRWP